jgi:aspartyl-tRNA synthetase
MTIEVDKGSIGQKVRLCGFVSHIRELGKVSFFVLRDREGEIQITLHAGEVSDELLKTFKELNRESVVEVIGNVKADQRAPKGIEIIPEQIKILSKCLDLLPVDPAERQDPPLDVAIDNRPIDLRRKRTKYIFLIQDAIVEGFRRYLRSKGFVEINTPKIVASGTEGGAELFPVQYFDKLAYLAQSPQFYKQFAIIGGLERVYEIGHVFRAEEHHTTRHLNEYDSMDVEMAFIKDEFDIINLVEELIYSILSYVKETREKELMFFDPSFEIPKRPFPRISFPEIYENKEEIGIEIKEGEDLNAENEKKVGEYIKKKYNHDFYFLTKFPLSVRPAYTMPDDPENLDGYSRGFDLIYKGMEIVTGGQRIHDYNLLVKSFKHKGYDPESFEHYIKFFKYGVPPHGGFAIGLERITKQLLNLSNIREATFLVRDRTRLAP